MLLFAIPTNVVAGDLLDRIPPPDEKVMLLKMSVPAPYSGVLMPKDYFRALKTFELENESLARALTEQRSTSPVVWIVPPLIAFGLGFWLSSLSGK